MNREKATAFIEENLKTLFAYSLSRVSHKEDAEDLTGEIVLAILQSADRIKNPDAFYGYVWRIADNTCKKFMKKKARLVFEVLDETLPDETDVVSELYTREDVMRLRSEIALLSKEHRECTISYYYDGLSCAEVAKKLGFSLEMVKYYLFKTRKILKEGISMEREFGEKSFRPAPFEFSTIFSGKYNPEYRNLFARKLPGQILLSAYYTSMTVRELAVELGVASVYLEDEIKMLMHYGLMTEAFAGKYQTNLVIFTDDFTEEFHKHAVSFAVPALSEILDSVKRKLGEIRKINRYCRELSDHRLLWGLLWPIMRRGNLENERLHPELQMADTLYDGATGTNYGVTDIEDKGELGCVAFAGISGIDEHYYASAADFGVLPPKNRYFDTTDRAAFAEQIRQTVEGDRKPEFMILTKEEEQRLFEILAEEIIMMGRLYGLLFDCARKLMHTHAPASVAEQVDRIVFKTLIFRTVGLMGYCAYQTGALMIPDTNGPVALYVCENTQEAKEGVNCDVCC